MKHFLFFSFMKLANPHTIEHTLHYKYIYMYMYLICCLSYCLVVSRHNLITRFIIESAAIRT